MKQGEKKRHDLHLWLFPCALILLIVVIAVFSSTLRGENRSVNRKVVLIGKSTESEFFQTMFAGARVAATEYNVELTTCGPDTEENYLMQNELIGQAVLDGANAVILSAVDYERNAEAVEQAAEAGLMVISVDSDVDSKLVRCRIGTDNYEAGRLAARAMLEGTDEDLQIGIVNFDRNTANGQEREAGFREVMAKEPRVKSMRTINVRSSVSDARKRTQEMIEAYPEINAIVTFNEWTSLGVGRAIRKLQKKDEIMAVGFDSNTVSVGLLETGELDALIIQNPYAIGYFGVETAVRLMNAEAVSSERIDTSTALVTRENMYLPEYQKIIFPYTQ